MLQAKLLRVLEDQSFRRLGGLKDINLDLRVVAATNKNLREAVKEGAFRQDLYFRLNVIQKMCIRDRCKESSSWLATNLRQTMRNRTTMAKTAQTTTNGIN